MIAQSRREARHTHVIGFGTFTKFSVRLPSSSSYLLFSPKMSTALGLWYDFMHYLPFLCAYDLICRSLIVEPNGDEPTEFSPPADVRITNVALGDTLQDEKGRTSLKMIFPTETDQDSDEEDEEKDDDDDILLSTTVLCSLTPGKVCCVYLMAHVCYLTPCATYRLNRCPLTLSLKVTTSSCSRLLARSE